MDVPSSTQPLSAVAALSAAVAVVPLSFAPSKLAKHEGQPSMDSVPPPPPGLKPSTEQGAVWCARAATLQLAKHRALPLKVRLPPHLEHVRLDVDPSQPVKKSVVYAEFGASAIEFAHKIDTLLPLKKRVPEFLLDDAEGVTCIVPQGVPR